MHCHHNQAVLHLRPGMVRDDADPAAAVPPVLRQGQADRRRLLGERERRGRGAPRRRHQPPAPAGLEIGRSAVGGRGHRAVRRRRGDGEGPEGEGVRGAGDEVPGGRGERQRGEGAVMEIWPSDSGSNIFIATGGHEDDHI